ncbi:hypothetical protein EI94DRAFT_760091 [Lactarius quietus]|nr:hypothetical protein EI94DRAFT_760091 [Lactarius quietus]
MEFSKAWAIAAEFLRPRNLLGNHRRNSVLAHHIVRLHRHPSDAHLPSCSRRDSSGNDRDPQGGGGGVTPASVRDSGLWPSDSQTPTNRSTRGHTSSTYPEYPFNRQEGSERYLTISFLVLTVALPWWWLVTVITLRCQGFAMCIHSSKVILKLLRQMLTR